MSINEEYSDRLTALMTEKLFRFSDQVKQIEVQLWDEDKGINAKHCLLEARIEGQQPVAVADEANTTENAIEGAVDKLKFALDKIFGRMDRGTPTLA